MGSTIPISDSQLYPQFRFRFRFPTLFCEVNAVNYFDSGFRFPNPESKRTISAISLYLVIFILDSHELHYQNTLMHVILHYYILSSFVLGTIMVENFLFRLVD